MLWATCSTRTQGWLWCSSVPTYRTLESCKWNFLSLSPVGSLAWSLPALSFLHWRYAFTNAVLMTVSPRSASFSEAKLPLRTVHCSSRHDFSKSLLIYYPSLALNTQLQTFLFQAILNRKKEMAQIRTYEEMHEKKSHKGEKVKNRHKKHLYCHTGVAICKMFLYI